MDKETFHDALVTAFRTMRNEHDIDFTEDPFTSWMIDELEEIVEDLKEIRDNRGS